jgi:hypothetical protein
MCQVSSSAWTAQNHRPQMPQWDVAVELQGSAIGETASQDHSRLRVSVWFDCCNISPPRAGSIHLAVAVGFQWEVTLTRSGFPHARKADPDIPILIAAKAEYAKLQ